MKYSIILAFPLVCSAVAVTAQNNWPRYHLEGSASLSIPVSGLKMTSLVFPVPVASAVKVSSDIKMYRPKGIRNVIELKAVRRNFPPTNITVYGINGVGYSFALHFVDDTSVLNFQVVPNTLPQDDGTPRQKESRRRQNADRLADDRDTPVMFSGIPVNWTRLDSDAVQLAGRKPFLKRSVSSGGIRLRLNGIYLRDSLLWLALTLRNRVEIGFTPSLMRIYIEDRKEIRRTASQQLPIQPIFPAQPHALPGKGMEGFATGMTPFVPAKGRLLVVELSDADGDRVLALKIKPKTVLKAKEVQP